MILPVEIASYASRLDLSKRAFARGILPTSFTYTIDIDERGEFRATVYDPRGREVMGIDEQIFEDGYMRHKEDLRGLAAYLEELGSGGPDTQVRTASYAPRNDSFARRAGRPLHEIARDIRRDWKNVHFAAVPYLQAMSQLDSVNESYFEDDGAYIVRYFLSNSSSWRGPVAKEIKAELKAMLPRSRFARFSEGDTAGFNKWLKTQPKDVQDDWDANKEKYGDKFKTAGNKMAKTFAQARADIFAHLKAEGWTVKEYDASRMKPMKVPWAKSPNGQDTLWFKAQAVYLNVHSLFEDIRNVTPQAFLKTVHDTIKIRKYGHKLNG